ncbi:MAG TPA: DHH family phosphoesterase [Oscillospiraceae bacterium]|nr:DHH family phosphoesterase [Oscillospiraceae bacterium]
MQIGLEECCRELAGMDDIVLLCHQNPDGDTLGSAFALHYLLRQLGKRSRVECADAFPKRYSFLCREYEPEEFEPKFTVAVDVADEQLLGSAMRAYKSKIDLCIDHHNSNQFYAEKTFMRAGAAAAAELVADIVAGFPEARLTKQIADCIYTGISTDTGCFCYSNTTAHTHDVAGRMFEAGCDYAMINYIMFEQKSPSRIAIEKEVLNTVEYHFDQRCALVWITTEMMERTGAFDAELEGVAVIPRQIEGVEAGITLREKDNGFKISLRTSERVDASDICSELGGGGHRCAAGCFIEGGLDFAKAEILAAVGRALDYQE